MKYVKTSTFVEIPLYYFFALNWFFHFLVALHSKIDKKIFKQDLGPITTDDNSLDTGQNVPPETNLGIVIIKKN